MSIQAHTFVAKEHTGRKKPILRFFYSRNNLVIVGGSGSLAVTTYKHSDAQVLQKLSAGKWRVDTTVVDADNPLSDSVRKLISDKVTLASDKEAEKYIASRAAKVSLAAELEAAKAADFERRYGVPMPGTPAAHTAAAPAAAAPVAAPEPTTFTVASAQYPKGTQLTIDEIQMMANAGVDADVLNDDGTWTNIKLSATLKEAGLVVRSASRFEKPAAAPLDALMAEIDALKAALAAQAAEK